MSPSHEPVRLLRRPAVEALIGVKRSALYRMMSEERFPRPVPLGDGKNPPVAWIESEVHSWIEQRIDRRERQASSRDG